MVAGPADDQYNDLLSKEVLQQLGLFGTPADAAEGAAPKDVPLLLQQPGGGLSGLGNAAKQVAELLAGTHPSMRGTSLEDWLAADGPVIAITATGLPNGDAAAAAAAAVGSPSTGASATPTPLGSSTSSAAVASSAPLSPSVAPPAVLTADTASLPLASVASGPMALQHQLALMQAAPPPQQQQQQGHTQVPSVDYGTAAAAPAPTFQPMGQPAQVGPATAGWQQAPVPAPAPPQGGFLPQQELSGLPADLLALLSTISGAAPAEGTSVAAVAPEDAGSGATPLLAQLLSELSGLQGLELPPLAPAAPAAPAGAFHGALAPAPAPQVSVAAAPMPSVAPSITLGGPRGMEEDEEEGPSSGGLFAAGADSKPSTLKRFSDRWACLAASRVAAVAQQSRIPCVMHAGSCVMHCTAAPSLSAALLAFNAKSMLLCLSGACISLASLPRAQFLCPQPPPCHASTAAARTLQPPAAGYLYCPFLTQDPLPPRCGCPAGGCAAAGRRLASPRLRASWPSWSATCTR